MLDGLAKMFQCNEREALRIALYEASRSASNSSIRVLVARRLFYTVKSVAEVVLFAVATRCCSTNILCCHQAKGQIF
jgi:hypothetical protein